MIRSDQIYLQDADQKFFTVNNPSIRNLGNDSLFTESIWLLLTTKLGNVLDMATEIGAMMRAKSAPLLDAIRSRIASLGACQNRFNISESSLSGQKIRG